MDSLLKLVHFFFFLCKIINVNMMSLITIQRIGIKKDKLYSHKEKYKKEHLII